MEPKRYEFKKVDKYCKHCGRKLILDSTRDIIRKNFCSRSCIALYCTHYGITGMIGKKHTDETKKKISKTKKQSFKEGGMISPFVSIYKSNPYFNRGKNNPMFNKNHTIETKEKLSLSKIGKKNPKVSKIMKEKHEDPNSVYNSKEYKEKHIKATLKGLMKRPTSFEQKISMLLVKYNLPFIYTGDGTFLIGYKNPDFVDKQNKIAIEVYHDYFKIRDFGSCEEYEKQRGEYFAKYGYTTIFIRSEEITPNNWEEICLNKINGGILKSP